MRAYNVYMEWIAMTAWTMEKPEMFGLFHFSVVFLSAASAWGAWCFLRNIREEKRIRILHWIGIFMAVAEVYKQLFFYYAVNGQKYDWWFFPFQLCSMAMYLCLFLPLMKKEFRKTVYVFLGTFSLLGTVCALAYPMDMMREYVTMTAHAFVYHALLIVIAVLCVTSEEFDLSWQGFRKASLLFLVMAAAAEVINVIGTKLTKLTKPNMFYISPYTQNTQPVFSTISQHLGIHITNVIYLLCIITGAALLHTLFRRLRSH